VPHISLLRCGRTTSDVRAVTPSSSISVYHFACYHRLPYLGTPTTRNLFERSLPKPPTIAPTRSECPRPPLFHTDFLTPSRRIKSRGRFRVVCDAQDAQPPLVFISSSSTQDPGPRPQYVLSHPDP
jgi:hypothetical protein